MMNGEMCSPKLKHLCLESVAGQYYGNGVDD